MAVGVDLNWPTTEGEEHEDGLPDLNEAPPGDEEEEQVVVNCCHPEEQKHVQTRKYCAHLHGQSIMFLYAFS
jgi:hypothetical protein